MEEGMCAVQTATSLRGFSRNNQNGGWEDTQQMRETTTAKAENKAMRAGMHSLEEIDLRVLYTSNETLERTLQGHPLGGGHPKRVPQEFCDAFHSAREDQSNTVSGSENETEVEEWDDIITYDTETSRYTTVADQECRIM